MKKQYETATDELFDIVNRIGVISVIFEQADVIIEQRLEEFHTMKRIVPVQGFENLARAYKTRQKSATLQLATAERSRVINSLANELESLRAILPSVAARASIELGVKARFMRAHGEPE